MFVFLCKGHSAVQDEEKEEEQDTWGTRTSLPAESQLMGYAQCFGAPVSTSAVKDDVVVVLLGGLHVKLLLEMLRGKLQRLLQGAHWYTDRHVWLQEKQHTITLALSVITYMGCWQPEEYGPPGIRLDFSHQTAECHCLTAWTSAGSRWPLKLKRRTHFSILADYRADG